VPFVGTSKKRYGPLIQILCRKLFQCHSRSFTLGFVLGILRANSKEMRQSLLECIYNSVESKSGNMIVDCSTHDVEELIDLCARASYISGMQREYLKDSNGVKLYVAFTLNKLVLQFFRI